MFNEHGSAGPVSYFVQVTNALAVRQGEEGVVVGRPVLPSCYLCLQKGHVLPCRPQRRPNGEYGVFVPRA